MSLQKFILNKLPWVFWGRLYKWFHRDENLHKRFRTENVGSNCYIDPSVQIIGWGNVQIGDNTTLSEDAWLNVNHRENSKKNIIIGNNCHIGRRNFFSSGPLIQLKDYCFTGIDCRFLGCGHLTDSPLVPYAVSGLTPGEVISVGVNCWLTTAVTVMQGVKIGHGSIIGAGSQVLKDIPPFSIAAGNPCRVIKRFNFQADKWVNTDAWSAEFDTYSPSEEQYLAILIEKQPQIQPMLLSSSSRFGWL